MLFYSITAISSHFNWLLLLWVYLWAKFKIRLNVMPSSCLALYERSDKHTRPHFDVKTVYSVRWKFLNFQTSCFISPISLQFGVFQLYMEKVPNTFNDKINVWCFSLAKPKGNRSLQNIMSARRDEGFHPRTPSHIHIYDIWYFGVFRKRLLSFLEPCNLTDSNLYCVWKCVRCELLLCYNICNMYLSL